MQTSRLLFFTALLLAPVALFATTWLYLYPFFDSACNFPQPPNSTAPFRLLALGDPQLEGDSSLPKPGAPLFPSLQYIVNDTRNAGSWDRRWYLIKDAGKGVPKDVLKLLESYRKRIDLWGNDWYLAHIVRTLRWWTEPSHVAVLGDLLGSQWIKDEEFARRERRYWDIVFKGMERVPDSVMMDEDVFEGEEQEEKKRWEGTLEVLGDDKAWENRVINIAGNHDIGYAGDIDEKRIERFEKAFGKVNWDIVFTLPKPLRENGTADPSATDDASEDPNNVPALRLVILNSMNLDTPAYVESLQRETYDFMNHIIATSRPVTDKTHATILLTHIPFYKESGVCVDSPYFNFFEGGSGVKEQNMLSDYASKIMLEGIFGLNSNHEAPGQGLGRRGIIVNGHDHEGCDVLHYITQPGVEGQCPQHIEEEDIHLPESIHNASSPTSSSSLPDDVIADNHTATDPQPEAESPSTDPQPPKWQALRFPHRPYKATEDGQCIALSHVPRIREITLRSMMGEFSGYAGFLSAWFDPSLGEKGEWKMEFSTCGLGVQHWWWAVHSVDFALVVALLGGVVARVFFHGKERVDEVETREVKSEVAVLRREGERERRGAGSTGSAAAVTKEKKKRMNGGGSVSRRLREKRGI